MTAFFIILLASGALLFAVFSFIGPVLSSSGEVGPRCPTESILPYPFYGPLDGAPNILLWDDFEAAQENGCGGFLKGRSALVVALAGSFTSQASLQEMAARIGAVSATSGLAYWSVMEGKWRLLVTKAYALSDPVERIPRSDFSAEEVLSGKQLYFLQEDNRSTSHNIYRLRSIAVTPNVLCIEISNVSAVDFTLLTLFEPGSLKSLHFFERSGDAVWHYYGLGLVRDENLAVNDRSFVNRSDAFYRFITRQPKESYPPLAP